MTGRWFLLCSASCLFIYDCGPSSRFVPVKPDPTKGTVTGTVICTDTGKPARFASVELLPSPGSFKSDSSPDTPNTETDLDGKFKLQAVPPGDYYAFATLHGYLDPIYSVDFDRVKSSGSDDQLTAEVIEQWKDHLVEVSVSPQRTTDISIQMERGAEITGSVAYDDGAPAIGMRFAFYRKNSNGWTTVGPGSDREFGMEEKSDARGRFDVTNLPAGEYAVCTLIPADGQASSPQICLGNTFRRRDAGTVTVGSGETVHGADIVIPLKSIHSVTGSLVQAITNQPPSQARVHLLYADDREEALSMDMFSGGSFVLPFVPEGTYILRVTDASFSETVTPAGSEGSTGAGTTKVHPLANREISLVVAGDLTDIKIPLVEAPPQSKPVPH